MSARNDGITNLERAARAWGSAAPEWITVLAETCDRSSQTAVARRLGYTNAVVSAALANGYSGRLDRLEQKVRGELMRETVICPVLGEISKRKCLDAQGRPYAATNVLRLELRRACPLCPYRLNKEAA